MNLEILLILYLSNLQEVTSGRVFVKKTSDAKRSGQHNYLQTKDLRQIEAFTVGRAATSRGCNL